MKVKLGDISTINRQTIGNKFAFSKMKYLDTSSITNGFITNIQEFDYPSEDIPSRAQRVVKDRTIIYSTVRPRLCHYGILMNPDENLIVSTGFVTIDVDTSIADPIYIFNILRNSKITEYLGNIADTAVSSYPSISPDDLRNLELDILEDINEQKKIGDLLNNIDKKIEINNKIQYELEIISKTLYDYWFLQFEFPNEEDKPYKSSGGKMIWNEELKREIPKGWEVENLMDTSLCEDIKAGVDYFEIKNYLPTANVNDENIIDGENITYENRESRANMQPIKFSVWFAKMKNSIKHITIPDNSNWFTEKYILSTGFQGLKCSPDSLPYIHCIINSNWFEKYKDMLSHGATQESVNNQDLKNIKFAVPSIDVLKKFSAIVLPVLEKKFSIIRENHELISLRDFTLPLLMNGQVIFKDKCSKITAYRSPIID